MRMTVGEVLGEAWTVFTRHSGRLILVAAIIYGFLSLVYAAVDSTDSRALLPISAGVTILGVLWLQGALVVAVEDVRDGKPELSIAALFRRVEPRLWVLLGSGIIAAVAIVGGLILFIVPGLVLLTFWSVIVPAAVVEKRGVLECFRRSQYLVSGNFFKVLAVILLTVAGSTIVALVITLLLAPLPRYVDVYIAGVVANSITMPFVAVSWTIMFFELRTAKEGFS